MSESKLCYVCKVPLKEESKGYPMGSPLNFHRVHADIYSCPKCERVLLFDADSELVACPVCGHMHHPGEKCIVCEMNRIPGANEAS